MIKGMSTAGRIFHNYDFIHSAQRALNFIHQYLWKNDRLYATHKDGKTQLNAYLDDYAFLLDAVLEILQAKWHNEYIEFAVQLADSLLDGFEHTAVGGFYFTHNQHEQLILRQKNFADDAIPSGNGIAAMALLKLGYLLAEPKYLDAAERCLKSAFESINQAPISHCSLLQALDIYLNKGVTSVVIRGDKQQAGEWQQALNRIYKPQTQHFYIPDISGLPDSIAEKKPQKDICAYICQGTQCSAPIYSLDALLVAL